MSGSQNLSSPLLLCKQKRSEDLSLLISHWSCIYSETGQAVTQDGAVRSKDHHLVSAEAFEE
jgi:hypothetical protein